MKRVRRLKVGATIVPLARRETRDVARLANAGHVRRVVSKDGLQASRRGPRRGEAIVQWGIPHQRQHPPGCRGRL